MMWVITDNKIGITTFVRYELEINNQLRYRCVERAYMIYITYAYVYSVMYSCNGKIPSEGSNVGFLHAPNIILEVMLWD